MKADKKFWIALNDQQVGLIMTTLARIQLFFSSSDEEYQGSESQVGLFTPARLSTFWLA